MSEDKRLLTIIDPLILEEMRKHLPADLIIDKVITSSSTLIIAPFELAKTHQKPFYVTDRPANYKEIFKAKGLGYLPKDLITTSFGAKLANILTDDESMGNLSDLFGTETEALKVSQFFQVGSLVDRLTENASETLNNYLSFHRSLYHLFQFLCYFANKEGFSPIECEKTTLSDGLAVQLNLKLDSEDVTLFKSILLKDENESKQFLTRDFLLSVEDCDFTDITFIQKTNRLVLTLFYASKVKVRLGGFRFSDNLSLIPRSSQEAKSIYPAKSRDVRVLDNQFPEISAEKLAIESNADDSEGSTKVSGSQDIFKDEVQRVAGSKEDLTEDITRVKGSVAVDNHKQIVSFNSESAKESFPPAKKFAFFIRNYREREGLSAENSRLSDSEILSYLEHYPRQEAVNSISDETKTLICLMVRQAEVYENVSRAIEDIGQSGFLDKVEEVQRVISSKNIEDIAEMITINGGKKDFSEEVIKVKGWLEDKKDELIKINSNYDGLPNDEKWEVKKLHINEVLREEVERIKAAGEVATTKDYTKILSEKLGISDEDSSFLVQGLVENSAGDMVVSRIDELRNTFEKTEVKEIQKTVLVNNPKLEEQIIKMKKIMDGMKAEIIRLRSASVTKAPSEVVTQDLQAQLVQVELEKTKQALANRDKVFKKFKEDIDSLLKEKDKVIAAFKDKVEQNKIDHQESHEAELGRKNDVLNLENRTLKTKLELAMKKLQVLSDNMDRQDSDFMLKKEREIDQLKNQISFSQSVIQKFKEEKQKLESEIYHLKDRVASTEMERKTQESKGSGDAEIQKRELIIQSLSHEKKSIEDQLKLQAIEFKKLEQKMKILTVQNDELTKKKGGSAKNVENAQRQVELANEKTKEAVHELTEKKKELLKLKNENSIQNVKIQELERKLASLERAKAS